MLNGEAAPQILSEWFGSARLPQYPAGASLKDTWLVMGGRGSGKTRLGAEWVNSLVRGLPPFAVHRYGRIALVGETLGDVREVMIEGPSGIRSISRGNRPHYEPSRRRLVWDNGAVALVFSSEDPDSLRGPQFDAAWCDELGCAAIDKGPNQPNVFGDPKSAESAVPYFSNGGRSDLAQYRFLMAHYRHWQDGGPAANPISPVYGGPMVDVGQISIWAWDARPFPAFPLQGDVWGDGGNWWSGHWLNGRLSGVPVEALIAQILADNGLPPADTSRADGMVAGYAVTNPATARAAIEPVAALFSIGAVDGKEGLVFATEGAGRAVTLDDLVLQEQRELVERVRQPDQDLPAFVHLDFTDPMNSHQSATAAADFVGAKGSGTSFVSFPGSLATGEAESLVRDLMRRRWDGRERVTFAVPAAERRIDAGSVLRLPGELEGPDYLVEEIEEGLSRLVRARRVVRVAAPPARIVESPGNSGGVYGPSKPYALFLDLPLSSAQDTPQDQFRLAVRAAPWRRQAVLASPEQAGFDLRSTAEGRATIGLLRQALPGGTVEGRLDRSASLDVHLLDGEFQSISRIRMCNGGNASAVRSSAGVWEILQFEHAEEIEPSVWRLSGLLRGNWVLATR